MIAQETESVGVFDAVAFTNPGAPPLTTFKGVEIVWDPEGCGEAKAKPRTGFIIRNIDAETTTVKPPASPSTP